MTENEHLAPDQKVNRAEEARRLLEHPLLREAFANLKLNYFEAWTATPPEKVNDRDAIYHMNRVLADVETHLRVVVSHGRIERAKIAKDAAKAQNK
jgi:hypothetical protein